jgi:DUF4097 and DUF4098 domain-containing protein YvlB
MPTETHRFATAGPITLHLRSARGTVQVVASDLSETVVEVVGRHDDPHTRVEASDDGRSVTVAVTRHRRLGNPPRLDITVRLPAGSTADLATASADITTTGPLDRVHVRTASGSIWVEQAGGDAEARSASGDIRLGRIGGAATLQSASGDLHVASAGGRCSASTASGEVEVGAAGGDVDARSASGDIAVRDAVQGRLVLHATSGDVVVGVRKGTLVWLDLTTVSGRTTSELDAEEAVDETGEQPLAVTVRTVSGSITVSTSAADVAAA